ncbi:hypothetical protein [Micromonospora rhizosphaerae]|uniref:hypothetical protein n=1 Tax=Micromonospora rhizosphaerae TaxID=568872 RepID=UPI00159F2342|nr:hypothetical protein [Micromonospora rhizosphaerae]
MDTTGTAVTKVADVSPDRYIWALDTAPDGVGYGGTYPGGRVFSYDPTTGTQRDYGVAVPGEQYVRSIAVDETTIYAGVGSHAHLIAIDRATGAKRVEGLVLAECVEKLGLVQDQGAVEEFGSA